MPPAGAPWWAFMVTAAVAVVAVIIANSSSNERDREGWRREQTLAQILQVLQDCGDVQGHFATLAEAKVGNGKTTEGAQARSIQIEVVDELIKIAIPFRRHMELINVMCSPAYSKHVLSFLSLTVASTARAQEIIIADQYDNEELDKICRQITSAHAELTLLSKAELRVMGFRSRFRDLRMKRIVEKIR